MNLRDEIAGLIADLGITRYRAAILGGVTPTHLYRFLKGETSLSVKRLDQLRNALTHARDKS